jgi:pilus assembly protein Flp/PilA
LQDSTDAGSLFSKEVIFVTTRPRGQGLAEYGLIITLVAIVVIVALQLLGPTISELFTDINNALP